MSTLLLGIDGGGTATRAVLASENSTQVLGKGKAGPGNIKAVGFDVAMAAILSARNAAFRQTGREPTAAAVACFALAGAGRPEDQPRIKNWAIQTGIAQQVAVVPDAVAVLAAGSDDVVGVSLIAGTGSMAFARDHRGVTSRAGGWGYLFGDEGSGYALALAGLRAAVKCADGRGPKTKLLPAFLEALQLSRAEQIPLVLYAADWDRTRIANLSKVVVEAAESDELAGRLLEDATDELVAMVLAATRTLEWPTPPVVAGTGGLILGSPRIQESLRTKLSQTNQRLELVEEPALGSIAIARRMLAGEVW